MEKLTFTPEERQALVRGMIRARKIRFAILTDDRNHTICLAVYSDDPEAARLLELLTELVTTGVGLLGLRGLQGGALLRTTNLRVVDG